MNRFLKWILVTVGVFAVLLVVITLVLPKVIDPNNYKEDIRAAVYEKTGRELTIGGEIEWTVFPSVGLNLTELSLSDRPGFGDQPMIVVGGANVSTKLISLFNPMIDIGEISLSGVSANLRQKANGQNNWEDLTGALKGVAATDAPVVSEIEISNGTMTLGNASQTLDMAKFGANATNGALSPPFELTAGFSINMAQDGLVGDVRFNGLAQLAVNGKWVGIENIDLSFKGEQGEALPLDITANANAVVDLTNDRAILSDFVLRFFDLVVNGELNVTSLSNGPLYGGDFKLNEFSPKSLLKNMGMEAPQTADNNALTRMSGDISVEGSRGVFSVPALVLKLDKSTIRGNFDIKGPDNPQLAFDFDIDSLNLDEYSSIAEGQGGTDSRSDNPAQAFGIFFVLPGGGDLSIGKLVASGLTVTEIKVKTIANANAIRMIPIGSKLYGGQQQGDIKLDISGSRPILTSNQVLTGVQLEGLLNDLTGNARLQGTADLYMKIRTDLTSSEIARRTLSGDIGLSVIDGAIMGVDVADTISTIQSALGQQSTSTDAADQGKKTEFGELIVTGIFDQGILRSDDLSMRSLILTATGKGTVNLVNETVNYVLKPVLTDDLGVEGLDQLRGVPIPVKISGSMYEPDVSVDVVAGLTGSQKAKLDEKKDELAKSLLDDLLGSKKDKKKKKK